MLRTVLIGLTLHKDDRLMTFNVKGATKEEAVKDPDLAAIIKMGWKIKRSEMLLADNDLLEFIKSKNYAGATWEEIKAQFSDIKSMAIEDTLSNLRCFINDPRIKMCSGSGGGVYVAAEYVSERPAYLKKIIDNNGSRYMPTQSETKKEVSKAEPKPAKIVLTSSPRKTIIDLATVTDIIGDAFSESFISSLPTVEKEYLTTLNDFKVKLIISEIRKKLSVNISAQQI